jgi:hypothetical protein
MSHRDQIAEASRKILELEREKQRIDKELKAWTAIRDAHEALATNGHAERPVTSEMGFTEAIRVVLGKHPAGLRATELRDELLRYQVSCGSEKNFLGNIHTVIKRTREIEEVSVPGGKIYRLRQPEEVAQKQ